MTNPASASIPKIIHQTWKTRYVPSDWRECTESWKLQHPGWEYRLWTDADCRNLVVTHYPHLLAVYDSYHYAIQRADAARYMLLHLHGGVYADLDLECIRPLDKLLRACTFTAAWESQAHLKDLAVERVLGNAFLAAVPGHPVLSAVLEELAHTRPEALVHRDVLESTGPLMLTRVVSRRSFPASTLMLPAESVYPIANGSPGQAVLRAGGEPARELKQALARSGSYTIHYWANSWVRNLAGELENPSPNDVPGYRFYPGKDSPRWDIRNAGRNVPHLARECSADPEAVAFNTDGFIKRRISHPFFWRAMPGVESREGLYVKESIHPLSVYAMRDFVARLMSFK
jgi:inositol phosphorylceramide mannosyltransferase catalytic subunit